MVRATVCPVGFGRRGTRFEGPHDIVRGLVAGRLWPLWSLLYPVSCQLTSEVHMNEKVKRGIPCV